MLEINTIFTYIVGLCFQLDLKSRASLVEQSSLDIVVGYVIGMLNTYKIFCLLDIPNISYRL